MSNTRSEDVIRISSVTIEVPPKLSKIVESIIFETEGSSKKEIAIKTPPGNKDKKEFDPPLILPSRNKSSMKVEYLSSRDDPEPLSFVVDLRNVMSEALGVGREEKQYFESREGIEFVIGIAPVPLSYEIPSVSKDVLSICPRLRLLVIGNSGAGKSALIKHMFGIKKVDVSDRRRGYANIDEELVAANNIPFVLHDTLGFEAGDSSNLQQVKDFVEARESKTDMKDRLHAVWVCLAVPYAKGRFVEAGTEEFLRDRKIILGDIPVIVALTQVDLLDKMMIMRVRSEGKMVRSIEQARPVIEPPRSDFLREWCEEPLSKMVGGKIAHLTVSTEPYFGLESTLTELLRVTITLAEEYIRTNPHSVSAIKRGKQRAY